MHGGKAPQTLKKSAARLELLEPLAILYLRWLLTQKESPASGLGASKEVLERTRGKVKDPPPAPQWLIDPARLGKVSTEDLEHALEHAEKVLAFLAGAPDEPPKS